MKTTVEIDDGLLRSAKRAAIDRGTTLRELVQRGLRRELEQVDDQPIRWVTVPGGLPPGLDLSDRVKMHEWLDADADETPDCT